MTEAESGLWASLPLPALVLDQEDRIAEANTAAEDFLNASVKSVTGTPVWDILMVDAPLDGAFLRVRTDHAPLFINDVAVGTGNRAPLNCTLQMAPFIGREGWVLLLVAPRDLRGRIAHSNSAKTAARSAIGMAEMLAHEIKNPLAGITGAAQLLSMNLDPKDREMTDLIVEESRRIVKLLEQVEQFGNIRPPVRKAINIHDILDRARTSALVGFAANMEIEEDYDPSLPLTFADGDQLVQVFQNLLKNAAQAAGHTNGRIRLRTHYDQSLRLRRRDGSGRAVPLQVEVIDNGPGLPQDIADEIFEPFVSGRENGTGLGLALVSKIISEHEGWIGVDSAPGRTVFRVSLPVAGPLQEEN